MPLTTEQIAEIRVLHEKRYNFCYDIVIPALCDSHDAQAARIAELERELAQRDKALAEAPHDVFCKSIDSMNYWTEGWVIGTGLTCDCWKAALDQKEPGA